MNKINIVVPMAGAGNRFALSGFKTPKPFIEIHGKTMIEKVLEGIKYKDANYILIIQESFINEYKSIFKTLEQKYNAQFINVKKLTNGATCTVLAAHKLINASVPLLICDCDNIIENNIFQNFLDSSLKLINDGVLMTYHSNENYFSFAKINAKGYVCEIKEKEVISNNAIAGFYFISKGEDFIDGAIKIMIYNERSKNEFYISNVYNYLIQNDKKISIFEVNKEEIKCVGTPQQLSNFLRQ